MILLSFLKDAAEHKQHGFIFTVQVSQPLCTPSPDKVEYLCSPLRIALCYHPGLLMYCTGAALENNHLRAQCGQLPVCSLQLAAVSTLSGLLDTNWISISLLHWCHILNMKYQFPNNIAEASTLVTQPKSHKMWCAYGGCYKSTNGGTAAWFCPLQPGVAACGVKD